MTLAEYLSQLRKAAGISRSEWAGKSGVSRMTLWRWENGQCIPHEYELKEALAVLDVPIAERRVAYALREEKRSRSAGLSPPTAPAYIHRGDLLRALRGRKGWSREEAARRAEIGRTILTRWERYEAWPAAEKIHSLAYALDASETELLALTQGMDKLVPPVESDDIEAASARLDAVLRYPPAIALMETEALGRMNRLAQQAKTHPGAAYLLGRWRIYLAYRLVGCGRIAEARTYLSRSETLPPDETPTIRFMRLQLLPYLLSATTKAPARLRRAAQTLLPQQKEALEILHGDKRRREVFYRKHEARLLQEAALSLAFMGRADEAVTLSATSVNMAQQIGEGAELSLFYERSAILCRAGRFDLILNEFPHYLGIQPMADSYLHLGLGKAFHGVGDSESAERHLYLARSIGEQYYRDRIVREADAALAALRQGIHTPGGETRG